MSVSLTIPAQTKTIPAKTTNTDWCRISMNKDSKGKISARFDFNGVPSITLSGADWNTFYQGWQDGTEVFALLATLSPGFTPPSGIDSAFLNTV